MIFSKRPTNPHKPLVGIGEKVSIFEKYVIPVIVAAVLLSVIWFGGGVFAKVWASFIVVCLCSWMILCNLYKQLTDELIELLDHKQ